MTLAVDEVRLGHSSTARAPEASEQPEPVRLLPLLLSLPDTPALTACLGLAEDDRALLLHLPSRDVAHVLVGGAAGCGKTELMRTVLVSLALTNRQSQLQLALIDLTTRGFLPLAGLPHLMAGVATDPGQAQALLERLVAELEHRERERVSRPHIVIAVDELAALLLAGGQPVVDALTHIAHRGRRTGLHLIVSAQKPSSTALAAVLKATVPVRLVGRMGTAGAGSFTRGDFVLVTAGQALPFQAAWIPARDIEEINHIE